mmetsp:Transcript_4438/g.12077  ORF Transcript_4438/g.12077 Transcript_4438/m.12077 type:complete len:203 (+) Transcript_4438:1256-1864(+)
MLQQLQGSFSCLKHPCTGAHELLPLLLLLWRHCTLCLGVQDDGMHLVLGPGRKCFCFLVLILVLFNQPNHFRGSGIHANDIHHTVEWDVLVMLVIHIDCALLRCIGGAGHPAGLSRHGHTVEGTTLPDPTVRWLLIAANDPRAAILRRSPTAILVLDTTVVVFWVLHVGHHATEPDKRPFTRRVGFRIASNHWHLLSRRRVS